MLLSITNPLIVFPFQESLADMNEEIQESSRETELELREELDMTKGKVAEYQVRLRQMTEDIADRQETIAKFRQAMESLKVSYHTVVMYVGH